MTLGGSRSVFGKESMGLTRKYLGKLAFSKLSIDFSGGKWYNPYESIAIRMLCARGDARFFRRSAPAAAESCARGAMALCRGSLIPAGGIANDTKGAIIK